MHRLLLTLAITAVVGSLFSSTPTVAQLVPPAKKAEHVEITQGPALELARDDLAIIRWTTNNPGARRSDQSDEWRSFIISLQKGAHKGRFFQTQHRSSGSSPSPVGRGDETPTPESQKGPRLPIGQPVPLKGIAFDGGYGIQEVQVSDDGGATWHRAPLGADVGRYSLTKMRQVSGAPISEPDARTIIQYLATVYGPHSSVRGTFRGGESGTRPVDPGWRHDRLRLGAGPGR
jgi:hypothetical protein